MRKGPMISSRRGLIKDPILALAGLFWLAFLSVGIFFFTTQVLYERDLEAFGVRVDAILEHTHTLDPRPSQRTQATDRSGKRRNELPTHYADYRFVTREGRRISAQDKVISSLEFAELKAGDPLPVVYSPKDPHKNEPLSFVESDGGKWLFRLLGVLIFGVASLPGWILLRSSTYEPLSEEEALEAWKGSMQSFAKRLEASKK